MTYRTIGLVVLTWLASLTPTSHGAVSVFTGLDYEEWQIAAGPYVSVDFTGFSFGTFITTQYQDLGVVFTDGNDYITGPDPLFPDDWGLAGNHSPIHMDFLTPQYSIGAHFIGIIAYQLFLDENLIYETQPLGVGPGVVGLVSDTPFDSAVFIDPLQGEFVTIDNLYCAPGIPAPSALPLLGGGLLAVRCRKR